MPDSPFFSVIIPPYNVEKYIKVCIDSILAQTFQDFEIIVVDGASTDKTYEICQNLYGANNKVRLFRHSQNFGISPARNTGMENARGKYIYFVDADDALLPNALEKLYKTVQATQAEVVHITDHCETKQDDDRPLDLRQITVYFGTVDKTIEFLPQSKLARLGEYWLPRKIFSTAWSYCCRRDFLVRNAITFLNVLSEDEIFFLQLLCLTERLYLFHDAVYIYRRRAGSSMNFYNPTRYANGIKSMVIAYQRAAEILEACPEVTGNLQLKNFLLDHVAAVFNGNHILPFYDGQNINPEMDKATFNELLPFFGENTALVKHFLHVSNQARKANIALNQQAGFLQQRGKQLELQSEAISVFTRLPINPYKIVFVNFNGKGYGCNPKYIAQEILRQNLPYDLVWLVNDMNSPMPDKIRKVNFNSSDAVRELSMAKVIVTNVKSYLPFAKKPHQYLIMTWHGCGGVKDVEKDVESQISPDYVRQSKINSELTDLMLAGSERQFQVMRKSFWYNGEIAKFGLPRNDIFFNASDQLKLQIRENLNIPAQNKIAMYAPTFRENQQKNLDVYKFDYEKLLEVMAKKFGGDWTLLVRFHPNVSGMNFAPKFFNNPNIINATNYPDAQELIIISDALISDYSGLVYEFTICRKPVFIFAKDLDTYPKERNLRPEFDKLPYRKSKTEAELFSAITEFDADSIKDGVKAYLDYLQPYDDGHAAARVVEVIKRWTLALPLSTAPEVDEAHTNWAAYDYFRKKYGGFLDSLPPVRGGLKLVLPRFFGGAGFRAKKIFRQFPKCA